MADVLFVRTCVLTCAAFLPLIMATELIPERAEVYYFNKKYFSNATAYVRRTGRKSPYYIYAEGTTLTPLGENVTLHGVYYEFLHNEYRRSFVQHDMIVCDFTKEPWYTLFGKTLMSRGFNCPLEPGTYRFHNIVVSMKNFPYVIPFEKAMLQGYAKFVTTDEILLRVRFYIIFKRELPKVKL